ncbi:hypothetical protein CIAM_44370 (plasmid) [Citrobacter amalonaticus]|nr:hypothetical protein CIAM_44370 [Citrobacter amalonaticus]
MAALKRRHRRRGGGGPDGTAGASHVVDFSHQTLAVWPETRRGSAETGGCCAAAWRSGARRLNRAAGQEPKGASFLPFAVVLVLVAIMTKRQHPAENHAGTLWLCLANHMH